MPEDVKMPGKKRKGGLVHFFLTVVLPAAVVVLLANLVIPGPSGDDLASQVRSALGTGKPEKAEQVLTRMIDLDPLNLSLHRDFIHLHYDGVRNRTMMGDPVTERYLLYAADADVNLRDVGYYALGLIRVALGSDYDGALASYEQVTNRELPYLNNSIGYCMMQKGRNLAAMESFVKEIQVGGNVAGAFSNLFRILRKMEDFTSMRKLLDNNPMAAQFIPGPIRRELALHDWQIVTYLAVVTKQSVSGLNAGGLAGAMLILLIWFFFLRSLDVFEPERLRYLVLILIAGMFFSVTAHVLYDLVHFGLGVNLNGHVVNDLLYCIFAIGGIEETVKIIPLLLLMAFTRQVDERVDYLIYAGVSALGFAFMENLLYFDVGSLTTIHGRAFTAVVLHMSLSAVAAWGLVKTHRQPVSRLRRTLWFAGTFTAAVVLHGLYDFFLMSPVLKVAAVSFLLLLIMIGILQRMIINALNNSRFWTDEGKTRFLDRMTFLQYGLTSVVLAEFLVLAISYGPWSATVHTAGVVARALIMILVLTQTLGVFPLEKGLTVPMYQWKGLFRKER